MDIIYEDDESEDQLDDNNVENSQELSSLYEDDYYDLTEEEILLNKANREQAVETDKNTEQNLRYVTSLSKLNFSVMRIFSEIRKKRSPTFGWGGGFGPACKSAGGIVFGFVADWFCAGCAVDRYGSGR